MSDVFFVLLWLGIVGVAIASLVNTIRSLREVAATFGWEEVQFSFLTFGIGGKWRGHAVEIGLQRNRRLYVSVALGSPEPFTITRRRLLDLDIGGPRVVDVGMDQFRVRCNDEAFVRSLLGGTQAVRYAIVRNERVQVIRGTRGSIRVSTAGGALSDAASEGWDIITAIVHQLTPAHAVRQGLPNTPDLLKAGVTSAAR